MRRLLIGLAAPVDARALVAVRNRLYPEHTVSEDAFSFAEHRYLLARVGEEGVGYLAVSRSQREGDPAGKLWAYLALGPGSGETALMRALYEGLEILPDARVLYTMTHESQTERQDLLNERQDLLKGLGYREILRSYGADLDVAAVDLSAFGDPETRLRAEGVVIHTLAEITSDPDYLDKLYALYGDTNRDIPEVGHSDTFSRAEFEAHLNRDDALPEAYHVAAGGDLYIGYSELFRGRQADTLKQEATAVRRSYRRRGVALALKLRGLAYAQTHGYTRVNTGMASNNAAMVALNTQLGFRPQRAYLTFCKDLDQAVL